MAGKVTEDQEGGETPNNWLDHFEERAAIREYSKAASRAPEAERLAWAQKCLMRPAPGCPIAVRHGHDTLMKERIGEAAERCSSWPCVSCTTETMKSLCKPSPNPSQMAWVLSNDWTNARAIPPTYEMPLRTLFGSMVKSGRR